MATPQKAPWPAGYDSGYASGYAAGLDDLQAKVEEWFCDVSLDDLRTVEFADVKA